MKILIQTKKEKKMEKALDTLQQSLIPYADKGYGAVWKKLGKGRYGVWITYVAGNRVFDFVVRREMKSTLMKIDKDSSVVEIKKRDEKKFDEAMSI